MTDPAPEPLNQDHVLDQFDCGDEQLNRWLTERSRKNEGKFSRTFVTCDNDRRVTGFYCLAAGAIERSLLDKRLQRNAPELIPVAVLGRLAVDVSCQGQGMGSLLLRDALRRTAQASDIIGTRLMLLHAKNEQVRGYYTRFGFRSLPDHSLTMILPIETMADAIREP